MRLFRRSMTTEPAPAVRSSDLDPVAARARMLRVAAEAVVVQDDADAVLASIRAHVPLGYTARGCGRLVRRFFGLRDLLPEHLENSHDERVRSELSTILHHHAELLSLAMELSAVEWQSDRLREHVESLHLGMPGERLETIYTELAHAAAYVEGETA
jgi:hypothetical protein